MTRYRFAQVLRLIALAQSGVQPFTQEYASAALHASSWLALHGTPLPPPRIGSAGQPPQQAQQAQPARHSPFADNTGSSAAQQQQSAAMAAPAASAQASAGASGDLLGADLLLPAAPAVGGPAAAPVAAAASCCDDDDDDLFGLRALQARAASHGAAASIDAATAEAAGQVEDEGSGLERRLSRSNAVSTRESRKGGTLSMHSSELGRAGSHVVAWVGPTPCSIPDIEHDPPQLRMLSPLLPP